MTIIEMANSGVSENEQIKPAKTMKEHHKRRAKCFNFKPLKDGETVVFASPAFDFRGGEDSQYGQHSVELNFAKRKGDKIVSFTIYTGWGLNSGHTGPGYGGELMSPGLYSHYIYKKDAGGYCSKQDDCPFTGKACYGELGSSLYADTVLARLLTEGTVGLWDEIDKELDAPA